MPTHPLYVSEARASFVGGTALQDLAMLPLIVYIALILAPAPIAAATPAAFALFAGSVVCIAAGGRLRRRAWDAVSSTSELSEAPLWYVLAREALGYVALAAVPLVCIASGSVLGLLLAPVLGGMVIGFVITAAVEAFAGETPRHRRVLLLRIPMTIAIQLAVLSEYIAAAASHPAARCRSHSRSVAGSSSAFSAPSSAVDGRPGKHRQLVDVDEFNTLHNAADGH